MGVTSIDHLYVETADWPAAVSFWSGLGFQFVNQWGGDGHRAGRLEAEAAAIVLAENAPDATPAFNAFFALDEADEFVPGPTVTVETPLSDTHWGTRWLRVADPDGRVYALEELAREDA